MIKPIQTTGLTCQDCRWAMEWRHLPGHHWCAIKGSDCWFPGAVSAPEWCPTTRAKPKDPLAYEERERAAMWGMQ